MVEGLLNPQRNGDGSPTPPPAPRSPSVHSDDSQPPGPPAPPGSASAIRNAVSQSQTPVKAPDKDATPTKDKVPETDAMFVENEVKTEPGSPCGQVVTNSPQDARQDCSIDDARPRDTFYSTDEAPSLDVQPGIEPERVKDIETGEGATDTPVESVVEPVKTRHHKPKKNEKSTPRSRRVLQGLRRPLGETFTLSSLPFDSSAISLPSIPDEDPRFHDLDTRSPVSSLPLRRYPCHPNLNSLLTPNSELQQTHLDNLRGRSKSGLNAGKF